MQITFEKLPHAVGELFVKLEQIESLLRQTHAAQTPPQESARWFSLEELCVYLPGNPKKATIYGMVHSREIPHKKVGKRLAFLKSEIDQWLNSKGRKTSSEIEAEAEAFIESKKRRG